MTFCSYFVPDFGQNGQEKCSSFSSVSMNFHAVKRKNLKFIRSDRISECFYTAHCIFLHKFEESLSYIARACVEKYTVLENDRVTCCRKDRVTALYYMEIH